MTALVTLLGHGIGYSASPAMHNAAFAMLDIDARYELADVPSAGLGAAVEALRGPDRMGANVTQPHKLAVCDLVDRLGPEVARLGAANTIVRDGGRLVARNTDLDALAAELDALGTFATATVLGTGGAARAAIAALEARGATVHRVGRARWAEIPALLATSDVLVNATPIGTASEDVPVPIDVLRPDLAVLDLVYRPNPTRLVREARSLGARAAGGAGMLLRQAAASFELWTGRSAPMELMRDALASELDAIRDA